MSASPEPALPRRAILGRATRGVAGLGGAALLRAPARGSLLQRLLSGLPLLAAATILPGAARAQPAPVAAAQAAGEWRFGALFPFSGTLALLGDESFRGLELAVDDRGAAGLLGRPIRLMKGDATDAGQAVAELKRLAGAEHVGCAFGTAVSALGFAAAQAAELQGLPYFELTATADAITERGSRTTFRTCYRGADLAQEAARIIGGTLAPRLGVVPEKLRTAILYEDSLDGQGLVGALDFTLRDAGLAAPERIAYSARSGDFAAVVQRLRGMETDLVLHAAQQNDIVLFFRAMRDASWRPRLVIGTGAGYALTDTALSIGPDFDGALNLDFPQFATRDTAAPGIIPFVDAYKRKYGSEPRSGHSLAAFAGARMAFEAVQRAGSMDRDKLRSAVLSLDITEGEAANGWGARFSEKGQNTRAKPFLSQWRAGKLLTVLPEAAAVTELQLRPAP